MSGDMSAVFNFTPNPSVLSWGSTDSNALPFTTFSFRGRPSRLTSDKDA